MPISSLLLSKQIHDLINVFAYSPSFAACQFRGERPDGKFVRIPEDAAIGSEVFTVAAFPRQQLNMQALDGVSVTDVLTNDTLNWPH